MAGTILPPFQECPEEAAIIGRLLAGYGELEFAFASCLATVIDDDQRALRVLFRIRSETQRIEIADALMRPAFEAVGLTDEYAEFIGAMRTCKNIRNQYAHCHWISDEKAGLWFGDLDAPAKTATGPVSIIFQCIALPELRLQEAYFAYAAAWAERLALRHEELAGRPSNPAPPAPQRVQPPPRHSPPGEHPLPDKQTYYGRLLPVPPLE